MLCGGNRVHAHSGISVGEGGDITSSAGVTFN